MSLNRLDKELLENKPFINTVLNHQDLINQSLINQIFKNFSDKKMYHLSLLSGSGILISLWGQLHHSNILTITALICSFGFWTNMHIINYMFPKNLMLLPLARRASIRIPFEIFLGMFLLFATSMFVRDWLYLSIIEAVNYITLTLTIRFYIKFGDYIIENKLQDLFPKDVFQ